MVENISAITFVVHDMARSVKFYHSIGFDIKFGGEEAVFTSFYAGSGYLNLILQPSDGKLSWWGRVIFHVKNVDAVYQRIVKSGYKPSSEPEDATWGERYFHIQDPDGHELSFARPIDGFNK